MRRAIVEEASDRLMTKAPEDPMETKIQRVRRRVQETPEKFSQFRFAEGDDKFRPFLKASKLPFNLPVAKKDGNPVFGKSAFRTDKSAWAHMARVI